MRYKGRITDWRDDQGFGFVTPAGGGERVFVHIQSFRNRQRRPIGNEAVTYDLGVDSKGRPQGSNVAITDRRVPAASSRSAGDSRNRRNSRNAGTTRNPDTARRSGASRSSGTSRSSPTYGRSRGSGRFPLLLAVGCLLLVTVAVVAGMLSPAVLAVYGIGSGLTYFIYAWDKTAARNRRWRTSEQTLHLLSLLGGWPGAVIAQRRLRHKSRKRSFQIVFWITVVLNCAALVLMLTGTASNIDWNG